jgi:hypothetical protein
MAFKKKSARQSGTIKKKKAVPQPPKRTTRSRSSKQVTPGKPKKQPQRSPVLRASTAIVNTLESLNERLDIMLPEVMFRIAAIEHVLVKNQLCSYEELLNARQYIQEQELS